MEMDLLDYIHEKYIQYCENHKIDKTAKEVEEFDEKYVIPILKQNYEAGSEMEEMFHLAVAQSEVQAFKDGFMTCMYFMIDYFKGNL